MIMESIEQYGLSRRQVLILGGTTAAATAILGLTSVGVGASPRQAKKRLAELTKGAVLRKGRIKIDLPALTQDGRRTRIRVSVDSPMSENDYVKALHILAERNTVPEVGTYRISPFSGVAEITTRIRVAKSQTIIAAAEMSDGTVFYAKARCKVARGAGGCG